MPIPRELFDQNLDPLDVCILEVLDADPKNAYTLEELADKVSTDATDLVNRLIFLIRLTTLRDRKLLESKWINGVRYYARINQPGK